MTGSAVTLPLNEGDVVLVHSIHTNGWADGTLLVSGARGWLPTNYCYAYDPDETRNLLKALLNFWDLCRSTAVNDNEIFGNQEFMKGIIAGVRSLLVRQCSSRLLIRVIFKFVADNRTGTNKLLDAGVVCHPETRRSPQGQEIAAFRTVLVGEDGEALTRAAENV